MSVLGITLQLSHYTAITYMYKATLSQYMNFIKYKLLQLGPRILGVMSLGKPNFVR